VNTKQYQSWLPSERIEELVQIEPALIILILALGAWTGSRLFFRDLSNERRRNLQIQLHNLNYHLFIGVSLFLLYFGFHRLPNPTPAIERLINYVGFSTILWGAIVFVKVCRILVFQYLFFRHLKVAFPVLLVNLFTLLLSLILGTWLGSEVFSVRLTPILATSAIFSLVLGLALQDTLGNLFAGVALQFDKPYEIGDWIEISNASQKWVGQVYEISWRATVLISMTEELITVPNRVMGQAEIANFSTKFRTIIRSVVFRLPFGVNPQEVKAILIASAQKIPDIKSYPPPRVLITETTESWIGFKLVFNIDDYGNHPIVSDRIYTEALAHLERNGFKLASLRVTLMNNETFAKSP
jgi:small-conductance mechanosensitive channel